MRKLGMRRTITVAVVASAVGALVATPVAVYASHSFDDVSDSNTFHEDIAWLSDAGVTKGCNPPENTEYCPEDNVTREQMAAFLHRLADSQVVDAGTVGGLSPVDLGGSVGVTRSFALTPNGGLERPIAGIVGYSVPESDGALVIEARADVQLFGDQSATLSIYVDPPIPAGTHPGLAPSAACSSASPEAVFSGVSSFTPTWPASEVETISMPAVLGVASVGQGEHTIVVCASASSASEADLLEWFARTVLVVEWRPQINSAGLCQVDYHDLELPVDGINCEHPTASG